MKQHEQFQNMCFMKYHYLQCETRYLLVFKSLRKNTQPFLRRQHSSRMHSHLSKTLISPYEGEYCSLAGCCMLLEVLLCLHFAGQQHESPSHSACSSTQLAEIHGNPTSARVAQPGLSHPLLPSCSHRTHCFCFFHICCSPLQNFC